jgi:hypothetical protein
VHIGNYLYLFTPRGNDEDQQGDRRKHVRRDSERNKTAEGATYCQLKFAAT